MKRTIARILGLAAAAFIGLTGLSEESALAQAPPQGAYKWSTTFAYKDPNNPSAKGNTSCYRLLTANGIHQIGAVADFIYCGAQIPSANPNLGHALEAYYQGMPFAAQKLLGGSANYQVIYYATVADKSATLTSSACLAWYQAGGGDYGLTNPSLGSTHAQSDIYEQRPRVGGTFPQSTLNDRISHTALHEAGHAFDWAFNTDGQHYWSRMNDPSNNKLAYFGTLGVDWAYLNGCSPGAIWQTDVDTFPTYFNCPSTNGSARNNFIELFAEQFSIQASGGKYATDSQYYPAFVGLDTIAIFPKSNPDLGTECSNEYVWLMMQTGSVPSYGDIVSHTNANRCSQTQNRQAFNLGTG